MKIINYDTIRSNIIRLKQNNELMLVLKNDAYGFNMEKIVNIAKKEAISLFAINTIEEAIRLRKLTDNDILLFGLNSNYLAEIKKYNIIPTANTVEEIELYSKSNIRFSLEIDIGMNRFGFKDINQKVLRNELICFIYIHFPSLKNITEIINKYDIIASMYNKKIIYGGSIAIPYTNKCVRIGEAIYKDALELYGNIINIKYVKQNDTIGYNNEYVMPKNGYVGIVDLGYYNGIDIHYDGCLLINSKLYQVVGRVCMNHMFVLIDEDVRIGQKAILIGKNLEFDYFLKHNKMIAHQAYLAIK